MHKSENVGERNLIESLRQNLPGRSGDVLYALKAGRHPNLRKDRNNKYIHGAQWSPFIRSFPCL